MMQVSEVEWSEAEQHVAKAAFDQAYERETGALMQAVREAATAIANPADVWNLHDFLSAKRHEIDGKYDYRYSVLIFVFARLMKEGWVTRSELEGLDTEKLAKIAAIARM